MSAVRSMVDMEQRQKARLFREMHRGPAILRLPNAWDVITARIFEAVGVQAIATTSVGIAAMLGYPDGQIIPCDEMLGVVRRIARSVQVPVTADIESGYGKTLQETLQNVDHFIDAGVVGINIEDSTHESPGMLEDAGRQAEKIAAIRELAASRDISITINARIDTMHHGRRPQEELLAETFFRAKQYIQAGADCIYVFGDHDKPTIERIVREINAPVNILAGTKTPPIKELQELGVARVSMGPAAMKATLGLVKQIGNEFVNEGSYESLLGSPMSYQELSSHLSRKD